MSHYGPSTQKLIWLLTILLIPNGVWAGIDPVKNDSAPEEVSVKESGIVSCMTIRFCEKSLRVYLAYTPGLRSRGLSGIPKPVGLDGMLFIYPEPSEVSYWMGNVRFPLLMFFLREDGSVVNHYLADVEKGGDTVSSYPSTGKVNFVLELLTGPRSLASDLSQCRLDLTAAQRLSFKYLLK